MQDSKNKDGSNALAKLGARAVGVGTTIWVIGNVATLGGHHAVGEMTSRGEPLENVKLILWRIDDVDDAFELAGLTATGIGFLALAWPPTSVDARPTSVAARRAAWSGFTAVVGLVLLATAAAYAARRFDLIDVLLVAGGVVLLPAWLVWTGLLLRDRLVESSA